MAFQGVRTKLGLILAEYRTVAATKWFSSKVEAKTEVTNKYQVDGKADRIIVVADVKDWQELSLLLAELDMHCRQTGKPAPAVVNRFLGLMKKLKIAG